MYYYNALKSYQLIIYKNTLIKSLLSRYSK